MASRRSASDTAFPYRFDGDSESHPAQRALESARPAFAGTASAVRRLPCSHCQSERTIRWGAAHGLPRYRCLSCKRTFNILTKTPLARLRNKERWLTYVGTMFERKSIRKSAEACAVSATTSSRWRHRFLSCTADQRAQVLIAIVAAYSNAPALAATPQDSTAANLPWCKELLPVVLSWFL